MAAVQTKDRLLARVKELQAAYEKVVSKDEESEFSEADVGSKFMLRLIEALGWDINNIDEVKEQKRTTSGPVDYSLNINRRPKLLLELKKFGESLDGHRTVRGKEETFPEQAVRYAWNLRVDWVILTNYKELRLYYSHVRRPKDGLAFILTYDKYAEAADRLLVLSKESVVSGGLDTYEKRRERENVDKEILGDLLECRRLLTEGIRKHQMKLPPEEVRNSVQKIIDRLIVIRVSEDRGIIGNDSIWNEYDTWAKRGLPTPFMRSLKSVFRDFDEIYNTKLFEPHQCEDLKIENQVLRTIIEKLYQYNFDLISADVLGAIYEDYIGHVLREKGQWVEIVQTMKARRSEGIYYTPQSIVEYIVRTAVQPAIAEAKTPEALSKLKIGDPATGSGSFLIKAFDILKEWYDGYHHQARGIYGKSVLFQGGVILVDDANKRILADNLYGVDKDSQAAEIASVNMMLKALTKDDKLPTILGQNIKQADSLTSSWPAMFPGVFNQGGFDIVVGNPPWGADLSDIRTYVEKDFELATGQYDSYELFVELSKTILKNGGTWGFIIPDSIFLPEHKRLREYLVKNFSLEKIAKLGEGFFENVFRASVILIFTKKQPAPGHMVTCLTLMKEDRAKMKGSNDVDLFVFEREKAIQISQRRFLDDPDFAFEIGSSDYDKAVMAKMEATTIGWADLFDTWRGVELSEEGEIIQCPNCFFWDSKPRKRKGEYVPKTCSNCGHVYEYEKALAKAIIVSEKPKDDWKPFLPGLGVNRYHTTEKRYIDTSRKGINYKDASTYEGAKLLVRKTGIGIYATIDNSDAYVPQVVFIFKLRGANGGDAKYRLEYILGVLNSRLMLYYYYKKFGDVEWKSFPYMTQKTIMQLPVAKIDFKDKAAVQVHDQIADKVAAVLKKGAPIDRDEDLEIEDLVFKVYGITPEEKMHVWGELDKVQKLRIIRETMGAEEDE